MYSLALFKWALTILWYLASLAGCILTASRSRAFVVKINGKASAAIVPFACMFNTQVNASYIKVLDNQKIMSDTSEGKGRIGG